LQRPSEAPDTATQAAAWLVRLEADVSAATQAQWRQWLGEDTRHHAAYVRIEAGWRQTDCLKRLGPLDGTVDVDVLATFPGLQLPARPRHAFRPKFTHVAFAAVAALVAVVTLMLALRWYTPTGLRRTDLGGFERTTLPDGSTVLLNTNTEIQVRFSRTRREVVLTRGEALFTVAQVQDRPFAVVAGHVAVNALGTAFAVRLLADARAEIVVARGRVAVTPGSTAPRLMLSAGDTATIDAQGRAATDRIDANDLDHRLAWTRGQIWLNEATLATAVTEFNRYNSRKFVLVDPSLATLRVGGSFAATDPTAFIEALERVFGIRALSVQDSSGAAVIGLAAPVSAASR
jgi:transmembrane sensor